MSSVDEVLKIYPRIYAKNHRIQNIVCLAWSLPLPVFCLLVMSRWPAPPVSLLYVPNATEISDENRSLRGQQPKQDPNLSAFHSNRKLSITISIKPKGLRYMKYEEFCGCLFIFLVESKKFIHFEAQKLIN